MAKYYCEKCHRMLDEQQFYKSNNMEKYPDGGRLTQCRKCLTMHVDNFDPSTFLWILEELDVPYIEEEWVKLIDKYCVDLSKVTGATIMGRYVAKMHLKQWRQYRWKDTDQLNREVREPIEQKMRERGMSEEEIEQQYPAQRLWELIDKSSRFVVGLYPVYYRERDREEIFNAAMMDQFTSCYGVLEINVNGETKAKAFEFVTELNFE